MTTDTLDVLIHILGLLLVFEAGLYFGAWRAERRIRNGYAAWLAEEIRKELIRAGVKFDERPKKTKRARPIN